MFKRTFEAEILQILRLSPNVRHSLIGHSFLIFSFTGSADPKFAVFENKINVLLICHYIYADPFFLARGIHVLKFETTRK